MRRAMGCPGATPSAKPGATPGGGPVVNNTIGPDGDAYAEPHTKPSSKTRIVRPAASCRDRASILSSSGVRRPRLLVDKMAVTTGPAKPDGAS